MNVLIWLARCKDQRIDPRGVRDVTRHGWQERRRVEEEERQKAAAASEKKAAEEEAARVELEERLRLAEEQIKAARMEAEREQDAKRAAEQRALAAESGKIRAAVPAAYRTEMRIRCGGCKAGCQQGGPNYYWSKGVEGALESSHEPGGYPSGPSGLLSMLTMS